MATFHSLKELIKVLSANSRLLQDMFLKQRVSLFISYDDAVEALGGDETKVQALISCEIVTRNGNQLELEETYQRFFEEALSVNEVINISSVEAYISKLKLAIDSYFATDNEFRKNQFLREVRHTFRSISNVTRRHVVDLKRNVNDTYKQEQDFKLKELRLRDFDEQRMQIDTLIKETEKVIDEQTVFFSSAMDVGLRQTVSQVRVSLYESAHTLIDIGAQIIDYLNRIEYQSRLVKKVRQLKYLKDRFMVEDGTDIRRVASEIDGVWLEPFPKYLTKVSLDYLRNDDSALEILTKIRRKLSKKSIVPEKLGGKIDAGFLDPQEVASRSFNHREIFNAFKEQEQDLFKFVISHTFSREVDREERLVLFLQLASQYPDGLTYTADTDEFENIEYPLIFHK